MRQEEPGRGPLGPIELRKLVPFEPCAASDLLGWVWRRLAIVRRSPLKLTGLASPIIGEELRAAKKGVSHEAD
jgi:hypothetical protein